MFFTETLTTKHLWADEEPSVLCAPRAKTTTKLRSEIEKKHWSTVLDLFSSLPVSMVCCRPLKHAWLLLRSSFFCTSWAEAPQGNNTAVRAFSIWQTFPPARRCYRCHQTFSGRILVHHNYWEGCKVPTYFTVFAGRIGGGLVINGPFVQSLCQHCSDRAFLSVYHSAVTPECVFQIFHNWKAPLPPRLFV